MNVTLAFLAQGGIVPWVKWWRGQRITHSIQLRDSLLDLRLLALFWRGKNEAGFQEASQQIVRWWATKIYSTLTKTKNFTKMTTVNASQVLKMSGISSYLAEAYVRFAWNWLAAFDLHWYRVPWIVNIKVYVSVSFEVGCIFLKHSMSYNILIPEPPWKNHNLSVFLNIRNYIVYYKVTKPCMPIHLHRQNK